MNNNPKISIITVVYNGEKYLEQTIQSVVNQSYNNIEYIIIDGASTDGTIDIIKKYENKISYWISEADGGIYDAMNKGIKIARGEFIVFLNADDYFSNNNVIYNVIAEANEESDFLYGNINYILENGNFKLWKGNSRNDGRRIPHPSCFIKSFLLKKRLFQLQYKLSADYEMTIYLFKKGIKTQYIDIIVTNFRMGGASAAFFKPLIEDFSINIKYFGLFIACKTMLLVIYSYIKNSIQNRFKK